MLFPHEQFSHQTMAEVEKYYFHAAFSRKAQTYYRVQIISVCKGRWIIEKTVPTPATLWLQPIFIQIFNDRGRI